ncbi:Vegetative incompatibility protein HET-E-1 [Colletotrichum tropicale]|nr:Vegetative incompatibility protein HET-E-1 [Colletotrichum tropicale]
MEALRAAIAAAQYAGKEIMVEFSYHREEEFVRERLNELKDFSQICDRIDRDPVLGRDHDTGVGLKRCATNISDIKVLLEEIISVKKNHSFRLSWKSIVGKDIEEEIIRLFDRLQREKALLELQIAAATSDAQYRMGKEHNKDLAAKDTQSSTASALGFSNDEITGFLGAVFLTNSSDERSVIISAKGKRVDGTCSWMLETDAYNTWMNTPCPGLWITGGPGMGKSMMSIFLTEHLEMKALKSATESVLYFFCDGQRDMRNNARGILHGLISQLVGLKPSLARHGILEEKSDWGVKTYDVRVESLCRTFNSMVEDPDAGRVFCVIDGLDECDNTSGELINSFLGVKTSRFKPVVVSRPLSLSLTSSLAKYVRLRLETHAEKEVKADLNAFIQQRVQQLSDDGGYPPALRQVLQDTFMKRSEGTFLWVELAAQELGTRPLADVETCLNSLPSGLSGIYSRILERIDPTHVRPVSRLLYVVTTAYNPMGIEDVESLLSIQPTAHLTAFEKAWGDARGRLMGKTQYRYRNEKESLAHIREILDCFKSSGANLNVQAADGTTPLMCCAYRNKPTCFVAAKWLIAAGVDVDTQDDRGNSCLHLAVVERKRNLVSALIDGGANQELRNNKGMTPKDLIRLRPDYWEVLETEVKAKETE